MYMLFCIKKLCLYDIIEKRINVSIKYRHRTITCLRYRSLKIYTFWFKYEIINNCRPLTKLYMYNVYPEQDHIGIYVQLPS